MSNLRKILYVLAFLLLIAAGAEFFLRSTIAAYTRPVKKEETFNPTGMLFTSNDLKFESEDGVQLQGWLIHGKPGYPVFVVAHDYGSDRSEVLARLEGLITRLNKAGYFVFLFDFRGHGKSGSSSTLGYRESADLRAALQAVLKYKNIGRRVGVLGVGMGAIAALDATEPVEEVRFIVFDSLVPDVAGSISNDLLKEWSIPLFAGPLLRRAVDWNLRRILKIPSTDLKLEQKLAALHPKSILFVEKKPLDESAKAFYEAAKEPKEMLVLNETAAGELIGSERDAYNDQLWQEIQKYFPPVSHEQTLELRH
jgi:pimeloyl-ACP methyl ester carboxylesterase